MKTPVLGALSLSTLLIAGAAHAQSLADQPASNTMGAPGQVAIAGDFGINFTHNTDTDESSLLLAPAVDYFIAPQLSLGGQLMFFYGTNNAFDRTDIGLRVRAGYNIPLRDMFSLYPRAGLGLINYNIDAAGPAGSASSTVLSLFFYAPFLFHPVPHFFIGLGPALDVGLTGDAKTTELGLLSTVGGWFDW
jgi:hypothetical protein